MKFTFDARSPELLRTDILKYIASCVDMAEGMKNVSTTKAGKHVAQTTINVLTQIIKDIQGAELDTTPL